LLEDGQATYSLELEDEVYGWAGNDLLVGGNGDDTQYGLGGDDCLVGLQNDDHSWGDNDPDDLDHPLAVEDRGADIYILHDKLGKDVIHDFRESDGDLIVNTTNTLPEIVDNEDGTWTVSLKGQNYAIVHVLDGTLRNGTLEEGATVISTNNPSQFEQCKNY
jgi:Ca2+-binding RTX toxin-like protein